jgi:hypothetical protein
MVLICLFLSPSYCTVALSSCSILLRELGSGKVEYNKYELVNVMVRRMDEAYLAGYISKAENIRTW